MENNANTTITAPIKPAKTAINFGIIFGLIMIFEFVLLYVMDIDPIKNRWAGVIMNFSNYLILPVVLILTASLRYKKTFNNGYITISDVIKIGLTIMIVASIVYGIFSAVFQMINPNYIDEMVNKMRLVMEEQNPNLTSEQLEMSLEMSKKFMQPYIDIPIRIAVNCFIGLIYSLMIGAAIQKKNHNQY